MCGIAGIITSLDKKPKASLIKQMTDKIIHRGPDEAGIYIDEGIGLGHRRLSIIDIKSGQQQSKLPLLPSKRHVNNTNIQIKYL